MIRLFGCLFLPFLCLSLSSSVLSFCGIVLSLCNINQSNVVDVAVAAVAADEVK